MSSARRPLQTALALALLLGLAGCIRLNQPAPQNRDYTLAYPPPTAAAESLPAVLQIPPFAVNAAYDSHGMMYREADHRLTRYSYDRWVANPGNLVADLLARDFAESAEFRAVQHARSPLTSDYRLVGEVEAIEEIVEGDRCRANLELRILLVAVRGTGHDAVLLRRGYAESEPVECGDATALARALSTALQRLSVVLRADVVAAAASDLGR